MEPRVVWADDPALPSGVSLTAFHGTDIESARTLLRGEPLNVEKAEAQKIDGPPGFFLATEVDDAMFFALRRAPGGVLAFREILLTAFAQKVVTIGASGRLIIKGEVAPPQEIWRLIESCAGWKRAIAFCL